MKDRNFKTKTEAACADPGLAQKIGTATDRQRRASRAICEELGDRERFRSLAADLRDDVLLHLDGYLGEFACKAEAAGVHVHWAGDAEEACSRITRIASDHGVKSVVKSKSMVTEEIGLTPALEQKKVEVVETDLGEFIIQLAGQRPSHIVIPAIHLSAGEVAEIFRKNVGYSGPEEAEPLTKAARIHLRKKFNEADMGISGVNFAVAEEGLWTIHTNEGNGRYVTTLPRVYVAVMGLERIVQDVNAAAVLIKLLARSATGQRITQYVNFARSPSDLEGPEHLHVVILDNGRSRILASPYWRMLRCIRCGACLNICPVFKHIGGQTFPGCYSGPMGSVLLPLLKGLKEAGDTAKACTLCRACAGVCPVKIPLPDLLLELRNDLAEAGHAGLVEKMGMAMASWIFSHPLLYRTGQWLMRLGLLPVSRDGWVTRLPGRLGNWTRHKDLPAPADKSFLRQEKKR